MKFRAFITSLTPEEVEEDKENIIGYYKILSDYIIRNMTEEEYIEAFNRIANNMITKETEIKNHKAWFYSLDYLRFKNRLLGEIKTTDTDKAVNISSSGIKDSTRHHILQCGLLDCLLGG